MVHPDLKMGSKCGRSAILIITSTTSPSQQQFQTMYTWPVDEIGWFIVGEIHDLTLILRAEGLKG